MSKTSIEEHVLSCLTPEIVEFIKLQMTESKCLDYLIDDTEILELDAGRVAHVWTNMNLDEIRNPTPFEELLYYTYEELPDDLWFEINTREEK